MARLAVQSVVFALPLLAAACGPQQLRELAAPIADCGPPSWSKFHGVRSAFNAAGPLPPEVLQHWVDGCAIVSFSLDSAGKIVDPSVVLEAPYGSGAGALAIIVLQRDIYTPNSEQGFDTMTQPGPNQLYAMTVGFGHVNGRLVISKRTVIKHQTIHIGTNEVHYALARA